jgi:Rrf2 family iron-sulfur cluster assembly transcriptional regulator
MLSKSCVYGIRALLYISLKAEGQFVSIKEISNKLDISFHFLTKILQSLTQKGLIESFTGPKGGVRLARQPESITILEIIVILDGDDLFEQCILGLPGCQDKKPCPLHVDWKNQREQIRQNFKSTDLKTLALKIKNEDLRLYEVKDMPNSQTL